MKIILRESSEATQYELFQRLNTGGSQLSDQELRNAILMMVNPDGYRWIAKLSQDEHFQTCTPLSNRLKSQQYDLELVTRFLVFRTLKEGDLRLAEDLSEFLTDRITDLVQSAAFNKTIEVEEKAFRFTFDLLSKSFGEDSFRRYDAQRGQHRGPFLISAFEPIAMGLGYNFKTYAGKRKSQGPDVEGIVKSLWVNDEFLSNSGSGVGSSTRIRANIPLGRQLFAP